MKNRFFDCYTKIDDDNHMIGHFCPDGDCGHCQAGVPFLWPTAEIATHVSLASLHVLQKRALGEIAALQSALTVLIDEAASREAEPS